MTVLELCRKIELQEPVAERVNQLISSYDFAPAEDLLKQLMMSPTAETAYKKLAEQLKEDEDNLKMLACQLVCAAKQYNCYQEKGISEEIYVETMKCFTRFIKECVAKTGKYAFDRGWWTYRQVSMVLFRIGELEYELAEENGEKVVSVHIPSDAKLTDELVDKSLEQARELIHRVYPEYAECDYICDSWLLSPKLMELLDENSKIIKFRNRFEIKKVDREAKDIFEWLFQTSEDTDISALKEDTSLQRKAKQLLMKGDNIGIAYGVLKE